MDIFVFADWIGMEEPRLMGRLTAIRTKGRGVFSFAYDQSWLQGPYAQSLDPDLQLYAGEQYLGGNKHNFGLFLDSSPDRWGRLLMDRREAILAKTEERRPQKLFEENYLLGVFDEHRMGALRFKTDLNGPFLNDNKGMAAPPWATLRELEHASLQLEQGILEEKETLRWLNLLLAPGASLGGARPKASVLDEMGQLWIAKFPSINDQTNVGAWEMVAYRLATQAGITMSKGEARRYTQDQHTFLSRRFDRQGYRRHHFASAMTLLDHQDGVSGVSYLELAEFIMRSGARVNADLEELFRRIVFNIGIKNTDDHLRNHGFLLTAKGWTLSPAYDVNPVYFGTGLTLNVSETDNSLDFDLALSTALYYRVSGQRAKEILEDVQNARSHWRQHAATLGISRVEQERMEAAFIEGK
ncbi:MAG TPA: HipA domain-containing protein [Flavisolibacter sp.]|nr:HipA domain-containing protein [Flavisolibacter sp.]